MYHFLWDNCIESITEIQGEQSYIIVLAPQVGEGQMYNPSVVCLAMHLQSTCSSCTHAEETDHYREDFHWAVIKA